MDTGKTRLLSVKDLRQKYGVGRLMASKIIQALPHVQIGSRKFAFAGDVEEFFERAMESKLNISEYVRRALENERGGVPSNKE